MPVSNWQIRIHRHIHATGGVGHCRLVTTRWLREHPVCCERHRSRRRRSHKLVHDSLGGQRLRQIICASLRAGIGLRVGCRKVRQIEPQRRNQSRHSTIRHIGNTLKICVAGYASFAAHQQGVSRIVCSISRCISALLGSKEQTSGRGVVRAINSTDRSVATTIRSNIQIVENGPITKQPACWALQTVISCIRIRHFIRTHQLSHFRRRARRHTVLVLNRFEQISSRLDVSHIQVLNIAFTRVQSLRISTQLLVQSAGAEIYAISTQLLRQHASRVRRQNAGNACEARLNRSGPHVTRRHQDSKVQNIIRVGGATETHFHGLTVSLIRIDQANQRHIAINGAEIRGEQNVTHATRLDTSHLCSRNTTNSIILNDDGVRGGNKTQTTSESCGGTQGQEAFLHSYDSIKRKDCNTQETILVMRYESYHRSWD